MSEIFDIIKFKSLLSYLNWIKNYPPKVVYAGSNPVEGANINNVKNQKKPN